MKNFEVTSLEDGKRYWVSRSVAVSTFLFLRDGCEIYVLANKRGRGSADFQGLWNCPCGYLDFDETGEEGAVREVKEETGYILESKDLVLDKVITDPSQNHQNVTLRYFCEKNISDIKKEEGEIEGGEEDEVEEIKLINIKEVDNYEWAFGHKEIIKEILLKKDYGSTTLPKGMVCFFS